LEHLGCKGLNIGTGYYENHGLLGHAVVDDVMIGMERFCAFFNDNEHKEFPHHHKEVAPRTPDKVQPAWTGVPALLPGANVEEDSICPRCGAYVSANEKYEFVKPDGTRKIKCVWCVGISDEEIAQDYIPGRRWSGGTDQYFD